MRRAVRSMFLTLLPVAVLASSVGAPPAGAHAEIRESDPPAGGTAATGTETLSLTFISMDRTEPVVVNVFDAEGSEQVTGEVEIEDATALGTTVAVPVQPLEEGAHVVQWRAMSSDGDGITSGSFEFTAEESSGGADWGVWLLWAVALGIPAAIFLRPRRRRQI